MPMIVDPSAPQIVQPERVTSADGYLAATVDGLWAGVVLAYDAATPADRAQNLVLNPSVGVDLANTQTVGSVTRTRITSDARYGVSSLQHTHTATGSAGSTWTISTVSSGTVQIGVWVKIPAGVTSGLLVWRSGTTTIKTTAFTLPAAGEWARIVGAYTLTAGQTCDRVGLTLNGPSGTTWLADGCMAQVGAVLHPYVDGDQPGCVWDGTPHASTSRRVSTPMNPDSIRKVRVVRQDPGGGDPLPVRSGDLAWALGGVGSAYDHEAPLGVAVIYTATPVYADGSTGAESSLAVTVPAPARGPGDVWIKSIDEPGISAQVTVTQWPALSWGARIDTADVAGNPFPAASQDVYGAPVSSITIDAEGSAIEMVQRLLTTPGVLLVQTRPDYHRPDQYVLVGNVQQQINSTPTEPRTYTADLTQVGRPDTAGQPMRIPGWSWDELARTFASWDAVEASYESWQSVATNGIT